MNLNDFPHIKAALSDIYPILPHLNRAMDEGATLARTTIDGIHEIYEASDVSSARRDRYDPWYLSDTARYVARQYLTHRGYNAELELDDLPNSGLKVRYKERVIRIRKITSDGGIPKLGDSEPWSAFVQMILSEEFACASPAVLLLYHLTPFGVYKGLSVVFSVPSKHNRMTRVLGCVKLPNLEESDSLEGLWQREESEWAVETMGDLPIEPLTAEEDGEIGQADDLEQAE